MKMRFLISGVWLAAAMAAGAATNDLSAVLQKGLFEEEANHNLEAAIQAYQTVIDRFDKDRKLAATAIFRLGECYRKQGNTNDAVTQYERVVREFADQTALVSLSRSYLADSGPAKPAEAAAAAPATSAEAEEVKRIQAMIKDSPDLINAKDPLKNGRTLLQHAALNGQLVVAQFLLANGADIEAKNPTDRERTPLIYAASSGHKAMVELLLSHGARVAAADGEGTMPLHVAAEMGFRSLVEVLLAHGADVDAKNRSGVTPLHLAAANGYKSVAELLLAHGAEVNATASRAYSAGAALHIAASRGDQALAELLLANKANVNLENGEGLTPLDLAADHGDVPMATLLLAHGADVNAANPRVGSRGQTPLYYATAANQKQMVAFLLKNKADPNAKCVSTPLDNSIIARRWSWKGFTPLLVATFKGETDIVELLLAGGADPNLKNDDGQSPIRNALDYRFPDERRRMLTLLLEHGADANDRGPEGSPPLIWSAYFTDKETVPLLLDHKADVDARTSDGSGTTLLMRSALDGDKNTVRLLLDHKADVNALDKDGRSALQYLTSGLGNFQVRLVIGDLLLAAGLDINHADKEGLTSLTRLLRTGWSGPDYEQLVSWLRQHGATEDLPRPDVIQIRRPGTSYSAAPFHKGTNDWNQFTLLELIAVEYDFLAAQTEGERGQVYGPLLRPDWPSQHAAWGFPDFARVRIRRPTADPRSGQERTVDLRTAFETGDCTKDVPLDWGEVVGLPEADHPLNQGWPGFSAAELANLKKCLSREVEVIVKGRATNIILAPEIEPLAPNGPEIRTKTPFWIKPALLKSNLLLTSSDLAHVKVTRRDPATGRKREWVVDCSEGKPAPDLWLRNGDVIEVPDKP